MDLLFLVTEGWIVVQVKSLYFLSHYYFSLCIMIIKEGDLFSHFEVVEVSVCSVSSFVFNAFPD